MRKAVQLRKGNKAVVKAKELARGAVGVSAHYNGHALVGFGPYAQLTRLALYQSTLPVHKKYVQSIIKHPVTHPGGQFDKFKQFILHKQEEDAQKEEDDALVQLVQEVEAKHPG